VLGLAREPDAAGGADGGDDDADGGATRVYSADLVWDPQIGRASCRERV
jgi:hypothetical protein